MGEAPAEPRLRLDNKCTVLKIVGYAVHDGVVFLLHVIDRHAQYDLRLRLFYKSYSVSAARREPRP